MTVYTAVHFQEPMPTTGEAGDEMVYRAYYSSTTTKTFNTGDIIRLARMPPGYSIVGLVLDTAACGTSCAGKVGILDSVDTPTTVSTANTVIGTASLATAVLRREDTQGYSDLAILPTTEQAIGIEITTGSGTSLAANAKVAVIVRYRPKQKVE